MKQELNVTKDNDVVTIPVTGHKYVFIIDKQGNQVFRSDSPGEQVNAILPPGSYTIDTDGKLGNVGHGALEARHRGEHDGTKPPQAPGQARK